MNRPNSTISPLVLAWLGLLLLTLASLVLGNRFGHAAWMPLPVAAIIWIKGTVVSSCFIESNRAHPLIAWIVRVFIGFVPIVLVLFALFGR